MSTIELDDRPGTAMAAGASEESGFAVSFSSGIRRIRNISRFLGVSEVVSPIQAARRGLPVSRVVVWGRKQNSQRARNYASRRSIPVQYIEDGWIRSCSSNAHSRTSYSLLVDDVGVYYDASAPSALESYLNQDDALFEQQCGPAQIRYAARCRQMLIENDITKYNFCQSPQASLLEGDGRDLVLVLDQTRDDASVLHGGMDATAFEAMLDRAVAENPGARIVVRTHPDVVTGRRQGYLTQRAATLDLEVCARLDNPIGWLKHAKVVYAGTSQLGYEALLCGCQVKVAGKPFYAGWGLTEDVQKIERRTASRSLDQLFHATHVWLARYRCPVSGRNWSLQDCLEHVRLQQDYFSRNAGKKVAVGITAWKRRYLAQFLRSPDGQLRFSARDDAGKDEIALCWSFSDAARTAAAPSGAAVDSSGTRAERCIRVEDGFIRSRGLGSDFVPPASLVFDDIGLYFDAGSPSSLERLLNEHRCSDEELNRARSLRRAILEANLTKYNIGEMDSLSADHSPPKSGKKRLLVIGQVEGDQSLLRGGREINSNGALLTAVRKANPDAFIVYKPHPDVVSGNRRGSVEQGILNSCVDRIEDRRHFLDCLLESDELHTMTSLSGFEALLRNHTVVTYGMPFYAGWGVTVDMVHCERRRVRRSIDELVFLCLIAYPHYLDLDSGEFISAELLIEKMRSQHASASSVTGMRWVSKVANVCGALAYRA